MASICSGDRITKSRAGQGGNFDKTVFSEAAAYMATEFPPKAGGPKTANSIADKWKAVHVPAVKKLHDHFLKIKQGVYVGVSGWTYPDEGGFNVTDDTRDAWHNFVKAHPHFKNFATRGWAHFQVVDDIVPSRAHGRYVFSAGAMQADSHGLGTSLESPDDDNGRPPSDALTQSSDLSQPLTDWSQTNFDGSQMSDVPDPASSSQIGTTQSQSTSQVARPHLPFDQLSFLLTSALVSACGLAQRPKAACGLCGFCASSLIYGVANVRFRKTDKVKSRRRPGPIATEFMDSRHCHGNILPRE
ncbi:hypothetical protein B0H14DRAFT_2581175 [Mycena olivaceomarginata]|nr:hypothetical protein B0H14DRAFT_2581175 [Mycena olivaceomarginata]